MTPDTEHRTEGKGGLGNPPFPRPVHRGDTLMETPPTAPPTPRSEAMDLRLATESWRNEQDATYEVLKLCYDLEREAYAWRQRAMAKFPEDVAKGGVGL